MSEDQAKFDLLYIKMLCLELISVKTAACNMFLNTSFHKQFPLYNFLHLDNVVRKRLKACSTKV